MALAFLAAPAAGARAAISTVPWVMQTEVSGVPEPATMGLLGLGTLLLAIRRKKRA